MLVWGQVLLEYGHTCGNQSPLVSSAYGRLLQTKRSPVEPPRCEDMLQYELRVQEGHVSKVAKRPMLLQECTPHHPLHLSRRGVCESAGLYHKCQRLALLRCMSSAAAFLNSPAEAAKVWRVDFWMRRYMPKSPKRSSLISNSKAISPFDKGVLRKWQRVKKNQSFAGQ